MFTDIDLSEETLNAVHSFGFSRMTPVQATSIPLFLTNKDVCVEATTGSGKTLAFGIPIFEIINRRQFALRKHEVGALVIAPTRELAQQIYSVLNQICGFHQALRCMLLVGGTSVKESSDEFENLGAQIVIGTPGRTIDIINRCSAFCLKELEVLVLDEADTLLDMGFRQTLNQILSVLPKQRRTGLFSATQTKEVKELARAGLRNPVTVSVKVQRKNVNSTDGNQMLPNNTNLAAEGTRQQSTPSTLENTYTVAEYDKRPSQLALFLLQHSNDKIIVFVSTCACVDYYSAVFTQLANNNGPLPPVMHVTGLHGKMVPKKRVGLYKRFVEQSSGVLFCTDVAARGVDIPDVDWIVQLAAPKDPAFFVHRVGRTARAGRRGGALLFVTENELPYIEFLRNRGVPMAERPPLDINLHNSYFTSISSTLHYVSDLSILDDMKRLNKHDRDMLEKGSTAFMSFLRAYKEHLCSYIFRFDELNIGAVARSYALLRLPKIPETKGKHRADIDFMDDREVDTSMIPYLHKQKEEARQRRNAAMKEEKKKSNDPDSSIKQAAAAKRQEEYVAKQLHPEPEQRKRKKKQGKHQQIMDEWEELAAEESLFKQFKKGRINKETYDTALLTEEVQELSQEIQLKVNKNKGKNTIDSSSSNSDNDSEVGDGDGDSESNEQPLPHAHKSTLSVTSTSKLTSRNRSNSSSNVKKRPRLSPSLSLPSSSLPSSAGQKERGKSNVARGGKRKNGGNAFASEEKSEAYWRSRRRAGVFRKKNST